MNENRYGNVAVFLFAKGREKLALERTGANKKEQHYVLRFHSQSGVKWISEIA